MGVFFRAVGKYSRCARAGRVWLCIAYCRPSCACPVRVRPVCPYAYAPAFLWVPMAFPYRVYPVCGVGGYPYPWATSRPRRAMFRRALFPSSNTPPRAFVSRILSPFKPLPFRLRKYARVKQNTAPGRSILPQGRAVSRSLTGCALPSSSLVPLHPPGTGTQAVQTLAVRPPLVSVRSCSSTLPVRTHV